MSKRTKAIFMGGSAQLEEVYTTPIRQEIEKRVDVLEPAIESSHWREYTEALGQADVIFSTWGAPKLDAEFLAAAPNLKAFFYGAGSVKNFVTDAFWESGVTLVSGWAANAIPVAEFSLAQIILCLKHAWQHQRWIAANQAFACFQLRNNCPGAYQSTVGLVSLGKIGRLVRKHLHMLEVNVIAYDPFVSQEDARELDIELVTLDELFSRADVVSLHTPWLKETEGMIRKEHFAAMREGASFINTARGAVVDETALAEVLSMREDLTAILDVTHPEPPQPDSSLWNLPNVVLFPHIAGSMGGERCRMGQWMLEEYDRWAASEPLHYAISKDMARIMA